CVALKGSIARAGFPTTRVTTNTKTVTPTMTTTECRSRRASAENMAHSPGLCRLVLNLRGLIFPGGTHKKLVVEASSHYLHPNWRTTDVGDWHADRGVAGQIEWIRQTQTAPMVYSLAVNVCGHRPLSGESGDRGGRGNEKINVLENFSHYLRQR